MAQALPLSATTQTPCHPLTAPAQTKWQINGKLSHTSRIDRATLERHARENVPGLLEETAPRPLGKHTLFVTPLENSALSHSFSLLRQLRAFGFTHTGATGHPVPDRVCYCHTLHRVTARGMRAPDAVAAGGVEVWTRPDGSAPRFRKIFKCANVWGCPVCSPRIASKRAEEVETAVTRHRDGGGECYLLTLTFRHNAGERLAALLDSFLASVRRFKQGATYTALKGEIGYVGGIRALELTYGRNGWHPHTHELIFAGRLTDEERARVAQKFSARWLETLARFGLSGIGDIACDFRLCHAADYLVKHGASVNFGISQEVANGAGKDAEGLTPWQLLELSDAAKPARLFEEFYKATKRRKQLFWSPGLKRRYLVPEITDEEILEDKGDPCILAGTLSATEYAALVARYGWAGVGAFLHDVARRGFPRAKENFCSPP